MRSTHLFAILTAVGIATASHAQNPGPEGDRPPGAPPAPRSDDGPRDRPERGPGPDHRREPGGSDDRQDHIREAMKHLRAAGLGHMAERIEQSLKNQPQGERQEQRNPGANRRRNGPPQWGAGRQFQHPRLPWGAGAFGEKPNTQVPFARPQQPNRRGPFADQGPRPGHPGPGKNDVQAQLDKLQREISELRHLIHERGEREERGDRGNRRDNDRGPSPEQRREHPGQPDFRKDDSRRGEQGDGPRDGGPRGDGDRQQP